MIDLSSCFFYLNIPALYTNIAYRTTLLIVMLTKDTRRLARV